MKRHLSVLVGVGCVLALTGLPVTPAGAGTVTFPVDSWTVTFSIPDFSYTGNECEKAPWTADFQGPAFSGSAINFSAEPRPTPAVNAAAADVMQDTLLVCPALHGSGTFDVTGEATVYEGATSHKAPFTTTFLVNPMATTTVLSGYRAGSYDWIIFSGSVLAHSTRLGDIGGYPGSQVVIEEQGGGGAWTRVTNPVGLDAAGNFSITMYRALTPGAFYRASYLGSTILHATTSCAPSASAPIQAPMPVVAPTPTPAPTPTLSQPTTPPPVVQPTPTVKVKAVKRNSKLRVDVDPNRGRGYWTFRVQRKSPDGSWATLKKTYRTKGSKEVRTVNLNRGTYRVWVNPDYGYQGVLSAGEVYLKK